MQGTYIVGIASLIALTYIPVRIPNVPVRKPTSMYCIDPALRTVWQISYLYYLHSITWLVQINQMNLKDRAKKWEAAKLLVGF
jgi:hypothetical protein